VHASLLPRYRGAAPVHRAVLAGDAETGVTIMRVVSELDAGPMFATQKIPIPRDATSGDIESALAVSGAALDLVVAAGGGSALRILELQPEGRRAMATREFLAGHRLTPGDRFGS
jgi:methionyl-tRNA formyltransferase